MYYTASSVLVVNVVIVPLYLLIGLARQHLQYVPHLSFSLVNFVFVEVSVSLSAPLRFTILS